MSNYGRYIMMYDIFQEKEILEDAKYLEKKFGSICTGIIILLDKNIIIWNMPKDTCLEEDLSKLKANQIYESINYEEYKELDISSIRKRLLEK